MKAQQELAEPKSAPARPQPPRDPEATFAAAQEFIEGWLHRALPPPHLSPVGLHSAMQEAVFPGGRRARPLLCWLVADYYGASADELVGRMAAAIELIHCASLVQDDLPCFDNAVLRRGRPTCHTVYGEATTILAGDALLTLAFETLAAAPPRRAELAFRLLGLATSAAGSTDGVIGGQGLELEPSPIDLDHYHQKKTAVLFRTAAVAGALLGGAEREVPRWTRLGELVGHALQVRDDLDDVEGDETIMGKLRDRDLALGRPNVALHKGAAEARALKAALVHEIGELIGPRTLETEALYRFVGEVTRPSAP